MRLNLNTKINDLIGRHPFLLEYLTAYAPEFEKLKSPIARATVGRIATVQMAARLAHLEPERLLADLCAAIERQTGAAPAMGEPEPATAEEATRRREALKAIVLELHDGKPAQELKERFDLLLNDVGSSEIGRMENELIAEGLPVAEVRRLCELHVDVFRQGLQQQAPPQVPPGHPVHTFMEENRVLERMVRGLTEEFRAIGTEPDRFAERRTGILAQLDQLAAVERHYVRKENLIFPLLEKAGVSGPPKVMWAVHDDLRALLKSARDAAASSDLVRLAKDGPAAAQGIADMVFKEEAILFPLSLELLTAADWKGVRDAEGEVGYVFITPGDEWRPDMAEAVAAERPAGQAQKPSKLPLDCGLVSLEQINLLLNHLPLDLSFVDEEDKVAYFTQGKERIFPRSPQVIGRLVQNCHPPGSVHIVNRILESFRDGSRDVAEFWIDMRGRFIHIRYFAVRDQSKRYRGCLEVAQDVTGIRALEGERRLLSWS
ncbi:MAG: DUF438 domain-containing protein [Deltaproteobacteria bacterium]|nr:DUF438 domain-containing protein [Deltaproteobacteria bacterium]